MTDAFEIRHILAEGRVQGVGYRDFVCRQAARLGVKGWVRNRRDGTVEALAVGAAAELEILLAEMRRGPPHSQVVNLHVAAGAASEGETPLDFVVRSTC